ncbi:hypothetical protein Droror1_Dr00001315 [Drosera rotundifolia]
MAASGKFDISASPDRPLGSSGQRGSFSSASFDRSGSFRESMGNPMLSSLPSMSRSSSAVTQDDVTSFFQCLRFDPKSIAADCKLYRQGELKRTLSAALGFPQDDSPSASLKGKLLPSSSDELKKAKSGLRESVSKARERVKIFGEALTVLNKCFPGITSRKRSRVELASGDRASLGPLNDRPGFNPSLGKLGTLSPALENDFEAPQQRPEERTKSSVISKRTRTSLLDGRANSNARPSMVIDKDRDVLRHPGSGVALSEDRPLSIGNDGWEKSKMRKKRSGIKPDVSPSKLTHKPVEGYREPKHGMQQRPAADIRSRLNDTHGFRPGMGNEVAGIGKPDGVLQQNGSTVRSPFGRGDQENSTMAWDRKDRSASDKERVNLKTANQNNAREDYSSASPTTSNTKVPSSARAPRSGIGALPKSSPTVHRQSASSDRDISQGTERPSASTGPSNRKRPPSVRSSSPPFAGWAGQRPQKISRTARRTNVLPIVSNNDESPALDNISDAIGNNNGSATRRFPSSSPQHVKLQGDSLSESEESGVAETKFKDKKKMFDEVDDKAGHVFQKGSPILPPPRKNKLINGEDLGDGVRRQGRTGRGLTSTRAPTFEKRGNIGTPKQLRTSKIGYERSESKAGRPPTRKISDRRAYTRLKHSAVPVAVEFAGDPQSELLAAANHIFTPTHESAFWRLMEPMLGFISELDTAFLKQQEECMSLFLATPAFTYTDSSVHLSNGFGSLEYEKHCGFSPATDSVDHFLELLTLETRGPDAVPLCQRLLAALVTEEDIESYSHGTNEGILVDDFPDEFQLHRESDHGNLGYELMENSHSVGSTTLNGIRITAMRRTQGDLEGYEEPEAASQFAGIQNSGTSFNFGRSVNGLLSEADTMPNMVSPDSQYDSLSIDERLLLEIHGIGIYPEQLEVKGADNDEISQDIRKLAGTYLGQVSRKKSFINKLSKLASETRENQEKECEQSALDELVMMAYGKYMGWDSSSTGKSNTSKAVRQAALPFVRRVLDNYRRFDATGVSCFNGPVFKDIFRSGPTRLTEARSADSIIEGESAKAYPTSSFQQVDENMENQDGYSPNAFGKEHLWSNKVKKRELLLDDVGVSSSGHPGTLSGNAKGKRSERDREGKGGVSRNGASRPGRPAGGNAKGERKSKVKPKQRTTQLSTFNGLVDTSPEQPRAIFPSASRSNDNNTDNNITEKDEYCLLDDPELQLPGIDAEIGAQEQDLSSWLNIDDEGLQDLDFMGLEIPMDDLANINMMV